jgi:hypothetical protein
MPGASGDPGADKLVAVLSDMSARLAGFRAFDAGAPDGRASATARLRYKNTV